MELRYRIPQDVRVASVTPRIIFSTPQGGKIALDAALLALWKYADGKELNHIIENFRLQNSTRASLRAALACLSETGLLIREDKIPEPYTVESVNGALVSAVIVNHDNQVWLTDCLTSLGYQNYSPLEIIVVDNASSSDPSDWLRENYPQVRLLRLEASQSLARALNQGIALANGEYFLLLNPDVRPQTDAVSEMAAIAKDDSTCAAVAAKLRFSWAPAFLNGIGNHVGAFSWGTDNALGHLDLGQFDSWSHVPSACFAAALIPRHAWRHVGQVDENFSLYYEDSEWSYRARLLGCTVRAAPHAIVYHAFGGRVPSGDKSGLSPQKLRHVVYGRLRFALKIAGASFLARFLLNYFFEDSANFFRAAMGRDGASIHAYLDGWSDFFRNLILILQERKKLRARRSRSDAELFGLQKMLPPPLIWHGLPELTWDLVRHHYLPLILSGKTRALPEFADLNASHLGKAAIEENLLTRARLIWQTEGWRVLLHRAWRYAQWYLARI